MHIKKSTLECKENGQKWQISHHKNVNKSKNRLTPLKLYSKNRDKNIMDLRDGSGGAIQSDVQEEPRLVTLELTLFQYLIPAYTQNDHFKIVPLGFFMTR